MDPAQKQLYGRGFPRRAGTPNQFWVYSEDHLDDFIRSVSGEKNAYSTISWLNRQAQPVTDKASIDLDSPVKGPEWSLEEVNRMKEESSFADRVLGDVCDDMSKLASYALDRNQKALGVYTGFGCHFHLLFEDTVDAKREIKSTVLKLKEDLGLETVDQQVNGDIWRILRIPNVQRIEEDQATWIWTVPLTADEMEDITPSDLVELAAKPRPGVHCEAGERKQMEVYDDYLFSRDAVPSEGMEELPVDFEEMGDDGIQYLMKELLRMPCMYERITQPDPDGLVRMNSATLLLNLGFSVDEIVDMFSQLGWVDWDRQITREKVEDTRDRMYKDMSCSTIMAKGLCTRFDAPHDCSCYQWGGGQCEWKDST